MLRAAILAALFLRCHASDQFVEFFNKNGQREVIQVSRQFAAPLCLKKFEQPPYYAWPLMQVYLLLKFDKNETNSQWFSWISSVGTSSRLQIEVRKRAPRWFCGLGYPWLATILPGVCKDCTKKCSVQPIQWADHLAIPVDTAKGCVFISQLPPGVSSARAEWYLHFDLSVFIFLLIGIVLVSAWKPLRESVALHAGLGGVGSLVVIAFMVLLWLSRSVRGTLHGNVPFGRSLTTLIAAAFAFIPAARNAFMSWTLRWLPAPNWQSWLGLKDPIFDLPIGWLAFLLLICSCLVLVHLGATLSVRYFASLPDPEGEVDFIIGVDGRRVDMLPPAPFSQRMLGWGIWFVGVLFLLSSTHSDTCSVIITLLVVMQDYIEHAVRTLIMWRSVDIQPKDIRNLISTDEMRSQASATTRAALAQLQLYMKEHPHLVQTGREAVSGCEGRRFLGELQCALHC